MAVLAVALPVVGFVGIVVGLVQEVFTVVLLALSGGVVAVIALIRGIAALRARRSAHESPAMAATAIAISVLPLLSGLLIAPSLGCFVGEGCGGG